MVDMDSSTAHLGKFWYWLTLPSLQASAPMFPPEIAKLSRDIDTMFDARQKAFKS